MNSLLKRLVMASTIGLLFSIHAYASTVTGNLNITMSIGSGCQVNNATTLGGTNTFGTIDFGSHPNLNAVVDANTADTTATTLSMTCSVGTSYNVTLDNGLYAAGSQRKMKHSSAADTIDYTLYHDAARSSLWNSGGGSARSGTAAVGSNTAIDLTVYGRVPPAAAPTTGTYSDTVQMTVQW